MSIVLREGTMFGPGWRFNGTLPGAGETFMHGERPLVAIRSRDSGRWHLSVSHRDRVPTWGELGDARDALLPPHAWMMVPHPPRQYWVNINPRVLHLWEFSDDLLINQFVMEGEHAAERGGLPPDDGNCAPEDRA